MGNRLLNMQRQVRELGRLRTGYTGPRGPVRSKTWILTGKERDLLDAAAAEWGGRVVEWIPLNGDGKQWSLTTETDRLPAFLPPGDPLTQAHEMWNRGGATRRCNGVTESKTGKPCLCLDQFGDDWHRQDKKERCQPYSHLNVMLLGLPDLGAWRHTTKSYYAAGEIAGMVDLIKARVGMEPIVPVWLIIDQRKKVADGTTTPYPVPIVKVRGAESGAALLSGRVPTLELGSPPQRQAIGSTPAAGGVEATHLSEAQVVESAGMLTTIESLQGLWRDAGAAKVLTDRAKAAIEARVAALKVPVESEPEVLDAEVLDDEQALWDQVIAASPFESMSELNRHFREQMRAGHDLDGADVEQLSAFLAVLKNARVPAGVSPHRPAGPAGGEQR
jgi:hypothetical protein